MELIGLPGNEVPDGLKVGQLEASDGVKLRYAVSDGPPGRRGTVCIFPGRADFIERFFETINDLHARRYAVAILDWRGQGGSDRMLSNRLRGHISSFRKFDRDFDEFINQVVLPDCPPPYFALAHSTGAQILLRSIHKHTWFDRVVMSSPFVGLSEHFLPRPVIRVIAAVATAIGLGWMFVPGQAKRSLRSSDFPRNRLTSDVNRFSRDTRTLEKAPHLGLAGPTLGWLNAAINSIASLSVLKRIDQLRTPVLFVVAGADEMVSHKAALELADRVAGIAAVKIDYARHELLNERDEFREQFWAAFDSFLEQPAQGLPEPSPPPRVTAGL